MSIEYWNNIYKNIKNNKITYDNWLDKYHNILNMAKDSTIIDLGCGNGNDTLYLKEKGFKILSIDNSKEALEIVKTINDNVMLFDISNKLPFEENSIKLIIADLSLHYFSNDKTIEILNEIKRVLEPNGYLIARVNSIDDLNYGATQGIKLEHHFYKIETEEKRFFDDIDIETYFSIIGKVNYTKEIMHRYQKQKELYEIVVIK